MENKFQTSFIPKKPIFQDPRVIRKSGGTSVFMLVAVLIFIVSISAAGFTLLYKQVLLKNQENYKINLKKNEEKFEIDLITRLKDINKKIDLSEKLLVEHIAISEIFSIINSLTTEDIRFLNLNYTGPTVTPGSASEVGSNTARIQLEGIGKSFSSIAWQSDVFGKSENYGKLISLSNPIISNLALEDAGVSFSFSADINPSDITYEKALVSDGIIETNQQ